MTSEHSCLRFFEGNNPRLRAESAFLENNLIQSKYPQYNRGYSNDECEILYFVTEWMLYLYQDIVGIFQKRGRRLFIPFA